LALLPSGLGITLLFEVDVLLLKVLGKGILLDEAVGHYQAARVAAMVVPFVASAVMTAVSPYIAKYSGTNRHSSYIRETLRYTALFSLPAATVLVVFPGSLLHAFFPAEYTSAATTLAILASRGLFLATLQVLSNALQSSGRIWWLSIVLSLAAVLELLLLWLVVPKYGLVGAAIGATVPVVLATTTLLLQEARTHHLIPPVRSTMKLATALGGLVAFLVVFPHGSRLLVFLDLLLAGIVYLLLLIRLRLIRVADIESLHQALAPIPAAQPMLRIMHRMLCRLGGHQHRPGSSA
jgi:stage V sporulation protein B